MPAFYPAHYSNAEMFMVVSVTGQWYRMDISIPSFSLD